MRFPIGFSDFRQLRLDAYDYVDKTALAADVVRAADQVLLFPRPRRFGKTLNLSMLRYWFERSTEDRRALFAGLAVTSAGPEVAATFQRYPTVYLTFKDTKHANWAACRADVAFNLRMETERLRPVWGSAALLDSERTSLDAIVAGTASDTDLHLSIRLLTRALHLATGEAAVLLIDEYDTPIHAGWSGGYYDEVIGFFRNFLSSGLKDNPHIYRGVLTGILRVAKESIFSGLNNVAVYSVLAQPFSSHFGFTEPQVQALCEGVGPTADLNGIREWYNGYRMGGTIMYNPWSVLRYLSHPEEGFQPYWVNTASHDLLRSVVVQGGMGLHDDLARLMAGGEIEVPISESIQLRDLARDVTTVWSFLLFTGYLKVSATRLEDGQLWGTLSIPNQELHTSYREMFRTWLDLGLGSATRARALCSALLAGDTEAFEGLLSRLVVESLSFFDAHSRTPEAVYQAFLVGLFIQLDKTHIVDSNRESGYGRYDVCVRPRTAGQPGAVLELKSYDAERGTPDQALDAAVKQLTDRAYATSLRQAGAEPVWQWAAVFDGKRVRARAQQA